MQSCFCKKIIIFALAILIFFPPSAVASSTPDKKLTVSIEDCIQMGINSSDDLREVKLEVEKAEIKLDDAAKAVTWIPMGGEVIPAYQQVMNGYQQANINVGALKKKENAVKDQLTKEIIVAYCNAIKNYDKLEMAQISLDVGMKNKRIASLNKELGIISPYEYDTVKNKITQQQGECEAAQATYQQSITILAALTGNSNKVWNPELTSRATLSNYKRDELSVELSRGTSESIKVWTQKSLRDIELSKQPWVLPDISSREQNIDLQVAEINYEQAKRDVKVDIESRYYMIDALEKQLMVKEEELSKAQSDLKIAQLRFENGLISRYIDTPTAASLYSAEMALEATQLQLDTLKAELALQKAEYAARTGKEVYSKNDWSGI